MPLSAAFLVGGNAGFEQAGLPFRYTRGAHQHLSIHWHGTQSRAAGGGDESHGPAQPRRAGRVQDDDGQDGGRDVENNQEAALNPIVERFDAYWIDELLPEIKQHIAYFESSDLRGMSLDQLRAHLAEALKRVERMGALHGVIMPMLFAMSQFEELYCELFEGASTLDALRLTQGFDNKTMEGDRALWRLSRAARGHARGA